jgi:hypothetical protein
MGTDKNLQPQAVCLVDRVSLSQRVHYHSFHCIILGWTILNFLEHTTYLCSTQCFATSKQALQTRTTMTTYVCT